MEVSNVVITKSNVPVNTASHYERRRGKGGSPSAEAMDPAVLPGDDDSMSARKMTGGRWNSSVSSTSSRSAEDLAGDGDAEPGSRSSGGVSKSSSRSNTCTAVVSAKLTRRERLRVSFSSSVPGDAMMPPRLPLPPKSMETRLGMVNKG